MRELGYVPNQLAGALASGARTRSVGVLVPTIANSIFADTVQGLSDELEPLGYAVILAQSRYDAVREDRVLAALLSRRPEAIIMVGSPATEDGARLLRRAGIPIVETWEIPEAPIDAVAGFDNYEAGCVVARHLVAQGRQNLAFIGGDDPRATRRWNGYKDTALKAGAKDAAPLDSGSQRVGKHRRAGRSARRGRGVCGQRCACHRLHVRTTRRRFAAKWPGFRAAGCRYRFGRSGNGPADHAEPSTIRVHGDAIGRTAAKLMLKS